MDVLHLLKNPVICRNWVFGSGSILFRADPGSGSSWNWKDPMHIIHFILMSYWILDPFCKIIDPDFRFLDAIFFLTSWFVNKRWDHQTNFADLFKLGFFITKTSCFVLNVCANLSSTLTSPHNVMMNCIYIWIVNDKNILPCNDP